ncbi:MAG: type II toxin-antitoxin system Phd/YefM family antitoxin [Candidatus Hodarchaeota archaeon]
MMDLNPQVLEKDGKKEFVVLSYEEFLKIQEELENYEDLRILREAKQKEGNAPTISLQDAKKKLHLE